MRINSSVQTLVAASLLMSSIGVMAAPVLSNGGTVHFKGEIVNAACSVSADSADQTVTLGQYRSAKFKAVGDKTGLVPFTIKLQDCDSTVSSKASVAFTGTVDAADPSVLAVSNIGGGSSGAASGVGIEISDSQGAVLVPNSGKFSAPHQLKDGDNVLALTARYKSTLAAVTPGAADADATFTMQYE
ncbi:type 1 fimbrial major subunit FimA [Pseudomonas sp. VB3]|uniref:type 1 fimbrial major subunit FimA n=1 Tax=Pseudomonas sp. VB3 TaxID=2994641 RepID=UPI0022EC41A4|nr:type 1 fimbrial major subunit FimA [Pseudomonas sp. VB3]